MELILATIVILLQAIAIIYLRKQYKNLHEAYEISQEVNKMLENTDRSLQIHDKNSKHSQIIKLRQHGESLEDIAEILNISLEEVQKTLSPKDALLWENVK